MTGKPTNQPKTTTMKITNYHNEEVTFTTGQTVTFVSDDGAMIAATIAGISEGLLDLVFSDGDTGSELPFACF
jgi:hypothetical protein